MTRLDAQAVHRQRLAEREQEYRRRCMELELAGDGIRPVGSEPRASSHGADAFVASLVGVDVDAVLKAVAAIHANGYAIVPLLDGEEVIRLREAMAPLFEDTGRLFASQNAQPDGRQTLHVQNVLAKTDAADSVAANARLRAIVAGVLGHDFILNAGAVAMAPDPGCAAQGLHRDDGFYAAIPRPHMPLVVTAAIALDDFTRDNGGTRIVPGSCLWPEERHPEPEEIQTCEMPAGSMLVWDGAIFHGGGANRSAAPRRTLTLNYTRGWLRTQFNQYLSVPRARVLAMPGELQADLGYHRSALGLGGCDQQDPLAYLGRLEEAGGDGGQAQLGREREL